MEKALVHTDQASSASQSQDFAPSWLLAKPVLPPMDSDSQQPESQTFENANADPYQDLNKDDGCTFAAKVAAAKNAAHERAKKAAQDAEAKKIAEAKKAAADEKAAADAEAMRVAEEAKAKKAAEDAEAKQAAKEQSQANKGDEDDDDDDGAKQGLKRKAMEMMDDPKFKKGTKLLDLSPNSQKVMKEIRKIRAIENSNRWHDTWDSKGKPRERGQPDTESSGPASGHSDGVGGQEHKDASADVEEQEHGGSDGHAGAQGDEQSGPRTLKDARVTCLYLSTIFILCFSYCKLF